MPRGLSNWGYKDVVGFLKEHGFEFYENREGSHEAWINHKTKVVVEVNYIHGGKSYPIRTLETMIRQSGIDKSEWKRWASGN